jgi:hypothetical protein
MATQRNLAISLLRNAGATNIAAASQYACAASATPSGHSRVSGRRRFTRLGRTGVQFYLCKPDSSSRWMGRRAAA